MPPMNEITNENGERPGVERGEGETWSEVAERLESDHSAVCGLCGRCEWDRFW